MNAIDQNSWPDLPFEVAKSWDETMTAADAIKEILKEAISTGLL